MSELDQYVELDQRVDRAEGEGLRARWEFGQRMVRDQVNVLALARDLGKPEKRSEYEHRRRFAIKFGTKEEFDNAVINWPTWSQMLKEGLAKPRPEIGEPDPLPEGVFEVVYADPPWRYEGTETPQLRAVELQYPTQPVEEIAAFEVPAADDAVCFLWATNPKLLEALTVLEAWGFQYRTNIVWVKDRIGMGYYVRGQHELLLIGKRGDLPVPKEADRPSSVLQAPRRQHSAKPLLAYDLIERMYPNARRLELYAREQRLGWESWGALAA